jgi:CRP/FNR family transcriptional regulator, nitrogen oxide reductase regulator
MPVEVKSIESLNFFKGMTHDELEQFAGHLNSRSVGKGDILLQQGTPALTFFIILSGTYKIFLKEGGAYILDKPGTVIGWSTVIGPFTYTGTAEVENGGDVLYISSRDFYRLIQNNNKLGEKIMKKINLIAAERRMKAAEGTL